MNKIDIDKLKILANNSEEYLKALTIKLRDSAVKNNHIMSKYIDDYNSLIGMSSFISSCEKCPFQIIVELYSIADLKEIWFDEMNSDIKCYM